MTNPIMPAGDAQNNGPIVSVRDKTVVANSRDVAVFFAKRHADVLRDVDNTLKSLTNADLRWFIPAGYVDEKGEKRPAFDMTRDGFTLLVMGYTGAKAMAYKVRYIQRFNEMEAALKEATAAEAVLEDPAKMRYLLLHHVEARMAAEARVAELEPEAAAWARIGKGTDGSLCLTDAAKALQQRPREFFQHLQARKWIYKRPGAAHWIGYQDKVQAGYVEHKVTEVTRSDGSGKVVEQVRITGKGLAKLAKDLNVAPDLFPDTQAAE